MSFFLFSKNCHGLSTIVSGYIFALMNRQLLGGNFSAYAENTDYRTEVATYIDDIENFYVATPQAFVTSESLDEVAAPYYSLGFSHTYSKFTSANNEFIPTSLYANLVVK